jgi:tetratricopeptide (TPR) repeat protein
MKKTLFVVVLAFLCLVAEAQVQIPAPSPAGSVSTTVGLTDVKIDYFRPRAKGRKIFGNAASGALVQYGSIWRTGANSGTKISFSDDVKVEGIAVPKGEYLIFTWPGATEWTVSLYKDVKLGGNTDGYDKAQEAANFKVKSEKLTEKVETFTIAIGDISDDSKAAKVQLAWDNTSVKFTIGVDFEAKVMKSIEANTKVNPNNYFSAAVYYLETGKDLKQALEWINKAAESNPNAFWILHQKAKIQKGLNDKSGALATANASLEGAKKANNRDYQNMNQELIKSLK